MSQNNATSIVSLIATSPSNKMKTFTQYHHQQEQDFLTNSTACSCQPLLYPFEDLVSMTVRFNADLLQLF